MNEHAEYTNIETMTLAELQGRKGYLPSAIEVDLGNGFYTLRYLSDYIINDENSQSQNSMIVISLSDTNSYRLIKSGKLISIRY